MTSDLQSIVLRSLRQSGILDDAPTLVVAVSGGCDSVTLLHVLAALRQRIRLDLHVASLDHGLRGAEGHADLDFVGELALALNLPSTLESRNVPQLARESGLGIEAAARQARYDFLARVARRQSSDCVAVAHHRDDQAETVLLRMARGSGLRGLGGMRPLSLLPGHPAIRLIRPLLAVSRADIETYSATHGLSFRQDASNVDLRYGRNFVRHELMPRLRKLNPQIALALQRLAESAATDEDWLDEYVAAHVLPQFDISAHRWRIGKADFLGLHPALQRRALRQAVERLGEGEVALSHDLALDLLEWSRAAQVGLRRDIGGGLQLRSDYAHLVVERAGAPPDAAHYRLIPRETDMPLTSGDRIELGDVRLAVSNDAQTQADTQVRLPADVELRLRTRRAGDRFQPSGMGGRSRKLKDWLIDRKIPRRLRDQIPLLCADGEIVAICLGDTWHLSEIGHVSPGDPPIFVLMER